MCPESQADPSVIVNCRPLSHSTVPPDTADVEKAGPFVTFRENDVIPTSQYPCNGSGNSLFFLYRKNNVIF